MLKLQGIAVSPGVVIGEAMVMGAEGFRIPRRFVARDAVESELERLAKAFEEAGREIAESRDSITQEIGQKYGDIFEAHIQILEDKKLRSEVEQQVRDRLFSPEHAVSVVLRRYAQVFQRVEHSYLAERANDIFDIEKRLLRHLLGHRREELSDVTSPVLVLASNLTPSETANMNREFVRGFVTELGGPSSHTAIVAAALEIPAVVGTGPFLTEVSGGDIVIIDGDRGLVIIQPDDQTLARYEKHQQQAESLAVERESLHDLPAVTTDGTEVQLFGNIEFPYEVDHCIDRGAAGIGLYRTEFLFLGEDEEPDEEKHYEVYSEVIKAMQGRPVTIRTFDLGADKIPGGKPPSDERNPFLGLRSIRLALRSVDLFRTQLRAILRASVYGPVQVMFPLVTTLMELRQAKMILSDVIEDLEESEYPFNADIKVGMMVEVPAAVVMIEQFVEEVDFLSIGTNDLIQYTLAVDRSNKDVVSLYNSEDPAILRLIDRTIRAAGAKSIPVNLCGQMSSSPLYTMLLVGMGLRNFSVSPKALPEIKQLIRSVTLEECKEIARYVMTLDNARAIKRFLTEELRRRTPELA